MIDYNWLPGKDIVNTIVIFKTLIIGELHSKVWDEGGLKTELVLNLCFKNYSMSIYIKILYSLVILLEIWGTLV